MAEHVRGAGRVLLEDEGGTDLVDHIHGMRISMSARPKSDENQIIGYNMTNLPTGEVSTAVHEESGEE